MPPERLIYTTYTHQGRAASFLPKRNEVPAALAMVYQAMLLMSYYLTF